MGSFRDLSGCMRRLLGHLLGRVMLVGIAAVARVPAVGFQGKQNDRMDVNIVVIIFRK